MHYMHRIFIVFSKLTTYLHLFPMHMGYASIYTQTQKVKILVH